MIKTFLTDSYNFGEQAVSLVDIHSRGVDQNWVNEKRASKVLFKDKPIKSKKGTSVLHLIAMGASPYYPCNKNGDFYYGGNEEIEIPLGEDYKMQKGLKDTHHTFVTGAKVYKEHRNKPKKGDKVYGDVLRSAYNDDMHRVELLVRIPDEDWADELNDMANGKSAGFSMSCRVSKDTCSICGHHSPNPSKYCDHLKYGLGQIDKQGRLVGAINDNVDFFDISSVKHPADRIAFGLLKAASEQGERVIGGAELSSMLHVPGYSENFSKFAKMLKKLAEMEKEVECEVAQDSPVNAAAVLGHLSDEDHDKVASMNSTEVLHSLTDNKVLLTPSDFFKVISGQKYDKVASLIPRVEEQLPGVFSRMLVDPKVTGEVFDFSKQASSPLFLQELSSKLARTNGMGFAEVEHRAKLAVVKGEPLPALIKQASVGSQTDDVIEAMTHLYGQYKLAFCAKHKDNLVLTKTAMLSHYIYQT